MIKFITTKWKQFLTGFIALFIGTCFASQVGLPEQVNLNAELMQTQYNKSAEIKERYSLKDTKLTTKIKHIDDIKITVGGIDEFRPIAEISKWENEVSMRVSPKTNSKSKKKDFVIDGEKIKYKEDKKEFHFYEIENGFEVEVILLSPPKTNIVEMEIETAGLDFFYQPELTQQEIDDGAFRPENVIGSYAVYHSTKSNHILGQKNYMTGKAFHIYRPKIIDNAGKEIWGSLNIDIENKLLTVEIPQEFLDTASYPVIVDPTFGNTNLQETTDSNSADFMKGEQDTPTQAGTATSITFYLVSGSYDDGPRKLGLYDLSGGLTDAPFVIGTDAYSGETPDNWITHDLTTPTEITVQNYGIVHWGEETSIKYDTGGNRMYAYIAYPGTGFPTTQTFSQANYIYSIYCTYTAGGTEEAPAKKQDVIWFE